MVLAKVAVLIEGVADAKKLVELEEAELVSLYRY